MNYSPVIDTLHRFTQTGLIPESAAVIWNAFLIS